MNSRFFIRASHWILYIAVFGVPLIFWRSSMFPFGIPKNMALEALATVLAGCWLALLALTWPSRRYWPKLTPVFWAVAAFLAALVLSGILGVDPARSFWSSIDRTLGIAGLLQFGLLYLALNGLSASLEWKKIWAASFAAASVVGASVLLSASGPLWDFFLRQSAARPGGLFGNATFAGAYLLWNVFLSVWLWREFPKAWQRWLTGAGAALQIAGILAGQTIAIVLGRGLGVLALLLFAVWRMRGRARSAVAAFLILAALAAGAVFFTRHDSFWQKVPGISRVASISLGQSDVRDRLLAWSAAWTAFRERPLLGWGFENYNVPFNAHYNPQLLTSSLQATYFDKPHNVYLEYLAVGGALGLLTYLGVLGTLGYELWRGARRSGQGLLALGLGAALLAYAFQNAFAFDTIATYLPLFLALGFAESLYAPRPVEALGVEEPRPAEAAGGGEPRGAAKTVAAAFVILGFVPVFLLDIPIVSMAHNYYNGINYYLNGLMETSYLSWQSALYAGTPYTDYARKDFASVVEQGFQQGRQYPDMAAVVKEGAAGLEQAAADHPRDYFLHIALADYYVALESFGGPDYLTKSKAEISAAEELSPNREQTYYILARERLMENDPQGAVAALEKAVALNPDAGDPHFTLGLLAYGLGNKTLGDQEIARAKALGRTPQNADEAIKLANFVGDLEGRYKDSADYLRSAIFFIEQTQPLDQNALENAELKLGVACYLGGDNSCAKQEFETLLGQGVDLKSLPIWPNLKPVLDGLGVKY